MRVDCHADIKLSVAVCTCGICPIALKYLIYFIKTMNRIILTLLCCAAGTTGAWGQTYLPSPLEHPLQQSHAWNLIQQQMDRQHATAVSTLKTTTNNQRLATITHHKYGGTPNDVLMDSLLFWWGGNRALLHHRDAMDVYYETINPYAAGPDLGQIFDTRSRYPKVQADSVVSYANLFSPTMDRVFLCGYDYNMAGQVTSVRAHVPDTLPTIPVDNYLTLSYTASGKLAHAEEYIDNTPDGIENFIPYNTWHCSYNANDATLQDSTTNLNMSAGSYVLYHYYKDGAGLDTACIATAYPQGSAPEMYARWRLMYTASGLVSRYEYAVYDGILGIWLTTVRDSLGYTGNNTFPTYYQQGNSLKQYNTLNSNGDLAQAKALTYNFDINGWDTVTKMWYYYNANDNPDSVVIGKKVGNSFQNRSEVYFFSYEPTGVQEPAARLQDVSLSVYPNPATEEVTVQLPYGISGELNVYDNVGRLIRRYNHVQHDMKLDVSRLPAGMYLVQYSGGDGSLGTVRFVRE